MGLNDGDRPSTGDSDSEGEFTREYLLLGKNAVRFIRLLCVVSFVACVGIAVFVFLNVPWDTRMPYNGQFNRSGGGIPMQIAMLPILAVLFAFWRSGKKSDAHQMRKGSRVGLYILGTAIVVACTAGQWAMGESILTAGGYFGN